MNQRIVISFESPDRSDVDLALLYWQLDEDGRPLYTVAQIATHLSIPSVDVSKRIAATSPAYMRSRFCTACSLPFKVRNRSELAAMLRDSGSVCLVCRDLAVQHQREERAQQALVARRLQEAIWLHNTSLDSEVDYLDLDYSDAIRAFALLVGSAQDSDGNLRFVEAPPYSARQGELRQTLKNLYFEGALLIGKGTPLDAFVPGDSVESFEYYPARVVWRFASVHGVPHSSVARQLASRIDNADSDYEYWNSIADIWWQEGSAEAFRYLNEQLAKYGLKAEEGNALQEAINHALNKYSIPQVRALLWKVAKDIGAFSAERGVSRYHAINAISGKVMRTVDRYVANGWEFTPYVLRWDDEESLLTTTLFDRVLKTGVVGFKLLSGEQIQEQRLKSLNRQPTEPESPSAGDVF